MSLNHVLREVSVSNIQPDSLQTTTNTVSKSSAYPPITATSLNKAGPATSGQSQVENLQEIFFCLSNDVPDQLEEMWTLKRATPIDEDLEPSMSESSNNKRTRRTATFFDPVPESRDDAEEANHLAEDLMSSFQIHEETDGGFSVVLL